MNQNQIIDYLNRLIHDDGQLGVMIDSAIRERAPGKYPGAPVNDSELGWNEQLELDYYDAHARILVGCLGKVIYQAAPLKDI
jgi:hypothetical protein